MADKKQKLELCRYETCEDKQALQGFCIKHYWVMYDKQDTVLRRKKRVLRKKLNKLYEKPYIA